MLMHIHAVYYSIHATLYAVQIYSLDLWLLFFVDHLTSAFMLISFLLLASGFSCFILFHRASLLMSGSIFFIFQQIYMFTVKTVKRIKLLEQGGLLVHTLTSLFKTWAMFSMNIHQRRYMDVYACLLFLANKEKHYSNIGRT